MTTDPLPAILDQLAAHREKIIALDAREAGHFAATAARQAGLADREIVRTLDSARRTSQPRADYQAEAGEGR